MEYSKKIEVSIVNAFTAGNNGGNPAGVVLNADNLTNAEKQTVATLTGLSETAFVSASEAAAVKLEFFTPTRQIAHCGHATVATFSCLKQAGMLAENITSKETIDGIREIILQDDLAFMEQKAPVYSDTSHASGIILSSLGITREDLSKGRPITFVNTGNTFAIIHVSGTHILKALTPDFAAIRDITETLGLIGFYVFAIPEDNTIYDATTRMFAPAYGIDEEAATGMAAGPLACYMHDVERINKNKIIIQQGLYMERPSPSRIEVKLSLENEKIIKLYAGGKAKVMDRKIVLL